MQKLFVIEVNNAYQGLELPNVEAWIPIVPHINRNRLLDLWRPLDFKFQKLGRKGVELPNVTPVYFNGVLAFDANLLSCLFPQSIDGIEFLPIMADGESWLILNCKNTVSDIDEKRSEVFRSITGEIFAVSSIFVVDPLARKYEFFTLRQSNRTQLFVHESFKDRFEKCGAKGVNFKYVGEILPL